MTPRPRRRPLVGRPPSPTPHLGPRTSWCAPTGRSPRSPSALSPIHPTEKPNTTATAARSSTATAAGRPSPGRPPRSPPRRSNRGRPHPPMSFPTKAEAQALLEEYVQDPYQRLHGVMVATAMEGYAGLFAEDPQLWYVTGLLHDIDFDRHPDSHPGESLKWFKDSGYPEDMI